MIYLQKKRVSFMYKNQHFIIDTFNNVKGKPSLLRIETEIKSELVEKPTFLKYFRDVTDEEAYATHNMAKKSYEIPKKDSAVLCQEVDSGAESQKPAEVYVDGSDHQKKLKAEDAKENLE